MSGTLVLVTGERAAVELVYTTRPICVPRLVYLCDTLRQCNVNASAAMPRTEEAEMPQLHATHLVNEGDFPMLAN